MTAIATVEQYFDALKSQADWTRIFADSITFTSYTSPVKQIAGRETVVKATQRFYASVQTFEVRKLIAELDQVCALTQYQLRAPSGTLFSSDVAEIFHVTDGQIDSFAIYFDSAPFK